MNKNRKKSKWTVVLFVLAVVVVVLITSAATSRGTSNSVNYTELYPTELSNSISIRGVVESAGTNNVHSNLGSTVKTVNVKVGDAVSARQILCVLDTNELENNIAQQKNQLNTLRLDLPLKRTAFENNKELLEKGYISRNELSQSEIAYKNVITNIDTQLLSIEKMEKQLSDSVIRAPASGTVTAVYAKEGRQGSGLLFVIEDTDNLVIKTTIKEYDITRVKVGMNVIIRSDSTGNASYEGIVSRIAPAAVKDANGNSILGTDIEFEAWVDIVSMQTELRIGMNTRLNVILEQKKNVYSVPYDAIVTGANGENSVFIISENEQNKQIAKQINVSTGIETDFLIEISNPQLHDGMKVISDASAIQDGMQISTNNRR